MCHNSSAFLYRYFSLWNNSDDLNETTSKLLSQDQSPMCWALHKQYVRDNPHSKEQDDLAGWYPMEEAELRSYLLAGMQTDLGSQNFLAWRQSWNNYSITIYGRDIKLLHLVCIYGKGDKSHTDTAFFRAEITPSTQLGFYINECPDFFTKKGVNF